MDRKRLLETSGVPIGELNCVCKSMEVRSSSSVWLDDDVEIDRSIIIIVALLSNPLLHALLANNNKGNMSGSSAKRKGQEEKYGSEFVKERK